MRSIFYASDADSDRYADALIGYARSGLPRSATPLSEVVIARSPRKHCAAVDEVGVLAGQLLQSADSLGSVVVRDPCGLLLQSGQSCAADYRGSVVVATAATAQ